MPEVQQVNLPGEMRYYWAGNFKDYMDATGPNIGAGFEQSDNLVESSVFVDGDTLYVLTKVTRKAGAV